LAEGGRGEAIVEDFPIDQMGIGIVVLHLPVGLVVRIEANNRDPEIFDQEFEQRLLCISVVHAVETHTEAFDGLCALCWIHRHGRGLGWDLGGSRGS